MIRRASAIPTAIPAGIAVVLLWASAFPAIRVAVPDLGAVGLSFARLVVATLVLLMVAVATRARIPQRCDLGWIIGCGFFGMTAYQVLLNEAEVHVPAGTASIIVAAAPLVSVAVARLLFAEPVTVFVVVGSAIALTGVVVVCVARTGASLSAAVWLAVGAMVVQGIYHPLQRPLLRTYTGLEVATYAMVAGTIMTVPIAPFGWSDLADATWSGWLGAVYLGVLPSALGFVLWGYTTSRLPVAVSTSLLYLVPPAAVLIAWLWLGEIPTTTELVGGLVVVAGVLTVSQGRAVTAWLQSPGLRRVAPPNQLRSVTATAGRDSGQRRLHPENP
ncbi:DMT family transporter [Mycobacterium sp. C3-094]